MAIGGTKRIDVTVKRGGDMHTYVEGADLSLILDMCVSEVEMDEDEDFDFTIRGVSFGVMTRVGRVMEDFSDGNNSNGIVSIPLVVPSNVKNFPVEIEATIDDTGEKLGKKLVLSVEDIVEKIKMGIGLSDSDRVVVDLQKDAYEKSVVVNELRAAEKRLFNDYSSPDLADMKLIAEHDDNSLSQLILEKLSSQRPEFILNFCAELKGVLNIDRHMVKAAKAKPSLAMEKFGLFCDQLWARDVVFVVARDSGSAFLDFIENVMYQPWIGPLALWHARINPRATVQAYDKYKCCSWAEEVHDAAAVSQEFEMVKFRLLRGYDGKDSFLSYVFRYDIEFLLAHAADRRTLAILDKMASEKPALIFHLYGDLKSFLNIGKYMVVAARRKPFLAMKRFEFYGDQPWAKDVVKVVAEDSGSAFLDFLEKVVDKPWAGPFFLIQAEIRAKSTVEAYERYKHCSWAREVYGVARDVELSEKLRVAERAKREDERREKVEAMEKARKEKLQAIALRAKIDYEYAITQFSQYADYNEDEITAVDILKVAINNEPIFVLKYVLKHRNSPVVQHVIDLLDEDVIDLGDDLELFGDISVFSEELFIRVAFHNVALLKRWMRDNKGEGKFFTSNLRRKILIELLKRHTDILIKNKSIFLRCISLGEEEYLIREACKLKIPNFREVFTENERFDNLFELYSRHASSCGELLHSVVFTEENLFYVADNHPSLIWDNWYDIRLLPCASAVFDRLFEKQFWRSAGALIANDGCLDEIVIVRSLENAALSKIKKGEEVGDLKLLFGFGLDASRRGCFRKKVVDTICKGYKLKTMVKIGSLTALGGSAGFIVNMFDGLKPLGIALFSGVGGVGMLVGSMVWLSLYRHVCLVDKLTDGRVSLDDLRSSL